MVIREPPRGCAGGGRDSGVGTAPLSVGFEVLLQQQSHAVAALVAVVALGGGRIDRDIMTMRGLAGWLENIGGPLVILGLFTRPVAFILSGEMAVAYFRNWAPRGFWESFQQAGMEASILFCYFFLFLSARGAGAWSLDAILARRGAEPGGMGAPATASGR